jgi:hypothetical protein
MKPSSSGFPWVEPPALKAFATSPSTSSRLAQPRESSTSVLVFVSQIDLGVKPVNFGCVISMTWMTSLMTMHEAVSSVNWGKPLDANLHLAGGPDLIAHDAALFDAVAVHPNDKGFAEMAERLAEQIRQK